MSKNRFVISALNEFNDPNANLKGCCNDGRAAFELCRDNFNTIGWDGEILFNKRATSNAIRTTIQQVVSASDPDDCIWVHHSGHGTIAPINGKSEHCNVPYDFDWNDMNTFVSGSQYQGIFASAKPGVKIYFTTDSCNSGGMLGRGLFNSSKNQTVRRNKFLQPPQDVALMLSMLPKSHPRGLVGDMVDIGFISGCGPNATDYSADVTDPQTGESFGAFSHYLFPLLIANKDKSIKEITAMVCKALADDQFDQQPTCGGARVDKPFLG